MENLLQSAKEIAIQAGDKLFKNFAIQETGSRTSPKDIKTDFDRIADEDIKKEIEKKFPKHSYLTEETGLVDKGGDYMWIVDPLDGTGNFMNSNPFFAVSIAVIHGAELVCGVIYAPAIDELFFAERGKGAFCENLRLGKSWNCEVSKIDQLEKSYLVYCHGGHNDRADLAAMIAPLYAQVKDMRILGSAALELAFVASGRAEAYITKEISIWDIAAGVILVEEAGGKVVDFKGNELDIKKLLSKEVDLLASNKKLQKKVSELLK
jgi:myo-inositol-1(or 4)-monophosphatase